jgi:hypothetical protein
MGVSVFDTRRDSTLQSSVRLIRRSGGRIISLGAIKCLDHEWLRFLSMGFTKPVLFAARAVCCAALPLLCLCMHAPRVITISKRGA